MKRFWLILVACLLVFTACFSAVGEEEEELTQKETKAVDQWYQQAKKKKLAAGKGQPLWAGKAVFACWYDPYDRFLLSSDYVRRNKDFYGLNHYDSILTDSLEEADLLIVVDAKYTKTGTYTDRSIAYHTDTLAYVIELKEKRLYGPYTMASNDPPAVISNQWTSHSGEFEPETAVKDLKEKWIAAPPDEKNEEAYRTAQELEKAGNCFQAREKYMESLWGDWRKKAASCEKSMPKTGVLWRDKNVKGAQATLTFQMKKAPKNNGFLARIFKDGTEAASVFIQGNGKVSVKLPAGQYKINIGMGRQWFGKNDAFGDDDAGDYYALWFTEESNTLALSAKKAVTIEMNYTEGLTENWVEGKYREKKGKTFEIWNDDMDWEDFRR